MIKDEELQALGEENRTLKALLTDLLPLIKEQLAQAHASRNSKTTWQKPAAWTILPRNSFVGRLAT